MHSILFKNYNSTKIEGTLGIYKGIDINLNDIIKAVMLWNDNFHPLTCGRDDCKSALLPSLQHGTIVLVCPRCEHEQTNIPTEVFSNYYETIFNKDEAKNKKEEI